MTKTTKALVYIAASALPIQELAYALPHRLEFPFCVAVACALVYVWTWARSSNLRQISRPHVHARKPVDPVVYISQVAERLAAEKQITVEDLKKAALEKGIELTPLQYANILNSGNFRQVGKIASPNPASKGRKIGLFTLAS